MLHHIHPHRLILLKQGQFSKSPDDPVTDLCHLERIQTRSLHREESFAQHASRNCITMKDRGFTPESQRLNSMSYGVAKVQQLPLVSLERIVTYNLKLDPDGFQEQLLPEIF